MTALCRRAPLTSSLVDSSSSRTHEQELAHPSIGKDLAVIAVDRLAEVFVEAADTLVDDFDLIEFLQRLTSHTSELFEVSAAGLLLADGDGLLQLMAAS